MAYKMMAVVFLSCLAGIKKPLYGGFAGMISAPLMSVLFGTFDLPTFLVLGGFGFCIGLLLGVTAWNIFHGEEYNQQDKKTYVMPISHPGSGQRAALIYSDEEARNAKENENS